MSVRKHALLETLMTIITPAVIWLWFEMPALR
jgi:hypothetical protein